MTGDSHYKAAPVGIDATYVLRGSKVGGFIAATAGTIQFTIRNEGQPDVVLPAVPLDAGQEWDMPFFCGTKARSTVTLAGGCSGIIFYA
jgi:hypothetical protein